MATKKPSGVIQKKATSFRQESRSLYNDEWAVHTNDTIILQRIYGELAKRDNNSVCDTTIVWKRRKVVVILVPFYIVEFLKKNKHDLPDYVSFHREKQVGVRSSGESFGPWKAWKEGQTTVNRFLMNNFKNWRPA